MKVAYLLFIIVMTELVVLYRLQGYDKIFLLAICLIILNCVIGFALRKTDVLNS